MSSIDIFPAKIALILRTARAALGINQQELAELVGVTKVTIARIETLETPMKADTFLRALELFRSHGIKIYFHSGDNMQIEVTPEALDFATKRLANEKQIKSAIRRKRVDNQKK